MLTRTIKLEDSKVELRGESESLLIESIPFENNMFIFPDETTYRAVKIEIGENTKEYEQYFLNRELNFSSFDKVSSVYKSYDEELTENEIISLLADNDVEINEYDEVDFKFPMMYQNLLLNNLGLIKIGNEIVHYDDIYKSIFKSIDHFEKYLAGSAEPVKQIKYLIHSDTNRSNQDASCECRNEFDAGKRCKARRIRGKLDIALDGFSDNMPHCEVDYDIDAQSRWFKKVAGIWWWSDADYLDVSINVSIFNKRRGESILTLTCNENDFVSDTNVSKVEIITFIRCKASGFSSECLDIDDENGHGIEVGESNHYGELDGDCGGIATCDNANCVN